MQIKSHGQWLPISLTAAGCFTLALSAGGLYAKSVETTGLPVGMALFLFPFTITGAVLTFFGVRGLIRLARFGGWTLDLPEGVGVLGTTATVTLHAKRLVQPQGDLTAGFVASRRPCISDSPMACTPLPTVRRISPNT
jgi:hypothetical protein